MGFRDLYHLKINSELRTDLISEKSSMHILLIYIYISLSSKLFFKAVHLISEDLFMVFQFELSSIIANFYLREHLHEAETPPVAAAAPF